MRYWLLIVLALIALWGWTLTRPIIASAKPMPPVHIRLEPSYWYDVNIA